MSENTKPIGTRVDDLIARLNEILNYWPDFSRIREFKQQMQLLQPHLAVGFEDGDLTTIAGSVKQTLQFNQNEREAKIDFVGEDEYSYRAILTQETDSIWRLRSLRPQCAFCFGAGISEGQPCACCDGIGWH